MPLVGARLSIEVLTWTDKEVWNKHIGSTNPRPHPIPGLGLQECRDLNMTLLFDDCQTL